MIPISLTIKGLYSYQEAQDIDFNKLTEGQLFGIFGAVGSGKSSILEAISFALYGETERLNLRENRGYNMMNLKSDELLIDFVFRNYDRLEYRFMVKGKRNKKDFEKVDSFDRTAYIKDKDHWIPLESAAAEKIIGLSYDNFRRTIIIPQGKFQEFLQLTDKGRTEMLKEIFQLDKYEFFYQTASLERKNNEALQNLKGQLSHFEAATRELIDEKEILVTELAAGLEHQKEVLKQQKATATEQESLKKLFEDLGSSSKQLENLLSDEQLYDQHAKKISDYEYCQRHFKDSLSRKNELEAAISQRKKAIGDLQLAYDQCCGELEDLQKESILVNEAFLKQDENKEILHDYQLILQLMQLKAGIETLSSRIGKGQIHVDKASAEKSTCGHKITTLKDQIREQKTALPDMVALADLRAWYLKKEQVCRNIAGFSAELKDLEMKIQDVSKEIHAQLTHPSLVNVDKGDSPHYYTSQVKELRKEVQEKQVALHNQVAHYNLQVKLGEFSSRLNNEEACMLCGSTHHPSILKVEDVQESIVHTIGEIDRHRNLDQSYESILHELSGFIQREQHLIQQAEGVRKKLNAELLAEKELAEIFNWSAFTVDDQQKVEEAFLNAANLQSAIQLLEKSLEEEERKFTAADKNYADFTEAIQKIRNELAAKGAEAGTLERQIKRLSFEEHEYVPEEQLRLKAATLNNEITRVKEQFEQLTGKISEHRLLKGSLQERKDAFSNELLAEEEKYKQVVSAINKALESSSYQGCDEVLSILADPADFDQLKEQLARYKEQLFAARQLFSELKNKAEGKLFDLAVFNDLLENIVGLTEKLEGLNTQFIKEKSALEQVKKDYGHKMLLEAEHDKLQHRAANLSTLKNLFKGSGFVSYISSVYLQNLCLAANERFYQLTRQQLRLEVTDKNDFQVRDFLNNGKVRSVKTLSGGQTFQASLSLALALAESVQQQNKAEQNFFFLDEGFGSLDKESLQVAFETLKSLKKENRIVGIISHVEELQQEIDVYLNVNNDPFSGSKIKGSWE